MKKIVRLTESDLTNIVKTVIKENAAKDSLIDMIKEDGWEETSELVGGSENLEKLVGIKTPMDFLHLFDNLNVVQSEETPDWTLFKSEKRTKLMVYNRLRNIVYINYYKFWRVLEYGFYLNDSEINELIQEWLDEVYNLRDVTIKDDMIITGNPNII
jgi:hypothetical protein